MSGRRLDAEMRVDDGAEFGRRREVRHERRRGIGRHREDDRIVGASAMVSPPKSSAATRSAAKRSARS